MFSVYNESRKKLIQNPEYLIKSEKLIHDLISNTLTSNLQEIETDYNEASYMYPFWKNYPPEERGRSPRGDQFPWIEVGEHSVGCKLARLISKKHSIREVGLPSGPDQRFLIRSKNIRDVLNIGDSLMVLIDVKSVGPRDDFNHTVLSTNQVSGDGSWLSPHDGIQNKVMMASGARSNHPFHCSLSPIYVSSSLEVSPSISVFVKPVYAMPKDSSTDATIGQPLERITIATLPNGLLLTENPSYLRTHPGLLYPGKDKKSTPEKSLRARIDFNILNQIDSWRVESIPVI